MIQTHTNLCETHIEEAHIIGAQTREWIVDARSCPALLSHHIFLLGQSRARPPYQMIRLKPAFSHFLICHAGAGEIFVDGAWRSCTSGDAYLVSAGQTHGFRATHTAPWGFCWIMYRAQPFNTFATPRVVRTDARPLQAAVQGLYREVSGQSPPRAMSHAMSHWTALVHEYATQLTQNRVFDERLHQLWEEVDFDLAHSWNATELARKLCVSTEHLRRLCHAQWGQSPMQHLTFLRMQRAAALLESSTQTVEAVAHRVGYGNAFAFSKTFKQWMGDAPSEYRRRAQNANNPSFNNATKTAPQNR